MHKFAEKMLNKFQGLFGNRGLSTEVRYNNQRVWQSGDPLNGSVKLDVVEGNVRNPTNIYDYKFGPQNRGITPARETQIRQVTGFQNTPINEIKKP